MSLCKKFPDSIAITSPSDYEEYSGSLGLLASPHMSACLHFTGNVAINWLKYLSRTSSLV